MHKQKIRKNKKKSFHIKNAAKIPFNKNQQLVIFKYFHQRVQFKSSLGRMKEKC